MAVYPVNMGLCQPETGELFIASNKSYHKILINDISPDTESRMREKKERPSHVSELLTKTSRRLKIDKRLLPYQFINHWEEIVGKIIAAHCSPQKIEHRVLTIRAEHPAWLQELAFLKPKIMERLNNAEQKTKIKDVKFEIGEISRNFYRNKMADPDIRSMKLGSEEVEFIDQAAKEITDLDLRRAAKSAMEMCLKSKGVKKHG